MSESLLQTEMPEIAKPAKPEVPKLSVILALVNAFHRQDITYCHWKSNEHLGASMRGDTDLDILFEEKQKARIEKILDDYGFKKFVAVKVKQYKDIEDFIGLDLVSGRIVHVHAHFKLTLGEAYLKGYQLGLEKRVLDSRIFDIDFGIYRSSPAIELILLYFRFALKVRHRDIIRQFFKPNQPFSKNVFAEYHWLKQRCSNDDMLVILKSIFFDYKPVYDLITREFKHDTLVKLSGVLRQAFQQQRLYSPAKAIFLRWYREIRIKTLRKVANLFGKPVISQRVHPKRGILVAMIGADGSGKSTVIADLHSTFRKKIDVYLLYMGKGKSGKGSLLRKILSRFRRTYSKSLPGKTGNRPVVQAKRQEESFKSTLYRCIEALAVARERRRKLEMMLAAKHKGMLIICDRFPQYQQMGYNDGPVLNHLLQSSNFLFRFMARKEAKVYQLAQAQP
ncbi:MAG: hypothetical protein EOO01_15690, partial [Chitinophagaceae bacterium]